MVARSLLMDLFPHHCNGGSGPQCRAGSGCVGICQGDSPSSLRTHPSFNHRPPEVSSCLSQSPPSQMRQRSSLLGPAAAHPRQKKHPPPSDTTHPDPPTRNTRTRTRICTSCSRTHTHACTMSSCAACSTLSRAHIPLNAQTHACAHTHTYTHTHARANTHLDAHSQGTLLPMSVTIGDTVLLPEYGGSVVKLGEDEFSLFREAELLGKLQ